MHTKHYIEIIPFDAGLIAKICLPTNPEENKWSFSLFDPLFQRYCNPAWKRRENINPFTPKSE